jgi:hypothetical protein
MSLEEKELQIHPIVQDSVQHNTRVSQRQGLSGGVYIHRLPLVFYA